MQAKPEKGWGFLRVQDHIWTEVDETIFTDICQVWSPTLENATARTQNKYINLVYRSHKILHSIWDAKCSTSPMHFLTINTVKCRKATILMKHNYNTIPHSSTSSW